MSPRRSPGRTHWIFATSWAFIRRDVLFETSYKLQSLVNTLAVFFQILVFYFLSKLLDTTTSEQMDNYGGNYFAFALVGITFRDVFDASLLMQFSNNLRQQLTVGVFEAMCATPLRPAQLMCFSLLWPVTGALLKATVYLVLGALVLGADIGLARIPLLLITLVLCILVFGSLAIIAGSLLLYFKRGDPVTWFMSALVSLVGGVFFPVEVLPSWLRTLSYAIPMPYALEALRVSLIPSAVGPTVSRDVIALALFALALMPTAWFAATKLFELSRRQGGLGQY